MFNFFKKIIPPEEPQNTNGKIVARVDRYSPHASGYHVEFSYIKDGVKIGNDSIHMSGDVENGHSMEFFKERLETFKKSQAAESFLKSLVGKPLS